MTRVATLLALMPMLISAHGDLVTRNAEIARQRMRAVWHAYLIYWNDHDGPPATLSALYPEWISDPETFWHPGDPDPPPTTIDNDVPDAPNSARISFGLDFGDAPHCNFIEPQGIRDNSAENNRGRFVLRFTGDWTEPPLALPTSTVSAVARANLRGLGRSLAIYINDSEEILPPQLSMLWDYCYVTTPWAFWNPGDADPVPTDITNTVPDVPQSALVSFEFPLAGQRWPFEPDAVVLADNSPATNDGFGVYQFMSDLTLQFIPTCPGDVTGDGRVRMNDLKLVQRNLGLSENAVFGDGDANGDGNVDEADLIMVRENLGRECK